MLRHLIILLLTTAFALAADDILGPNLLPNGDLELATEAALPANWALTSTPSGATPGQVSLDTTNKLTGRSSVKLELHSYGALTLTGDSFPVTAGQDYFARVAFRLDGLCEKGYCQGQAHQALQWLNEQGRVLRTDYIGSTYIALPWVYRDQIRRAPEGAVACRPEIQLIAREGTNLPATAWFDDLSVNLYAPPPFTQETQRTWSPSAARNVYSTGDAPSWIYPAGEAGKETAQGSRLRDPEALEGSALHSPVGVEKGYLWHSSYTLEQPSGLYRLAIRLKVPPETELATQELVVNVDVNSSDTGLRMTRAILRRDFAKPGAYEYLHADFVKRGSGWLSFRVYTPGGKSELWLDHVSITQLKRFQDPDLATWYPGIAPPMDNVPVILQNNRIRTLIVQGLLADRYRLRETGYFVRRLDTETITYSLGQSGPQLPGFPSDWDKLREYQLILFANASLSALSPQQRYLLREYVRAGGGLIFLGGKAAYGAGGMRGTFLDEVLPIQPRETFFDIQSADETLRPGKDLPQLTAGLTWDRKPHVSYLHDITLREGALVPLQAGAKPVAALSTFGRGRVTCILATPYGETSEKAPNYTDWQDWPCLFRNLILWTAQRDNLL